MHTCMRNTLVKVVAEYKHICPLEDFNLQQVTRLNSTSSASNPELQDYVLNLPYSNQPYHLVQTCYKLPFVF